MVPAVGPARAYPELFNAPLVGGHPTRLTAEVVAAGSSVYDTFPSLHVLITCILLDHDWRHVRQRFWIMLLPSLGLMASTIYLRYHYGVDVIAGFLLFLALRSAFLKVGKFAERPRASQAIPDSTIPARRGRIPSYNERLSHE
jgi:membrane-associated phospholipid phosphatase